MNPLTQYGPAFTASKYERTIINAIANRAVSMATRDDVAYTKQNAFMDIEACHCNGCPLDLAKLHDAEEADFGHDVYGIRRYMDRATGKLTDFFTPRTALPE